MKRAAAATAATRLRVGITLLALTGAALALVANRANAKEVDEASRNRSLVARGFDAWRDGTGSPYDLLDQGVAWTINGHSIAAKTYPTKEDFMREVIRPFNARMRTRLIPSVRKLYAEGDTVIALFDASGTARDGQAYANSYAWFLTMKGGRIIKADAFFDSIAFDDFWRRVSPAVD